jgi:hypothetical protein
MLHHQIFRPPGPGAPRVLAVFSYRYDAHLVPDLVENIRPGVNGYVAWDDRSAQAALTNEPARRSALFQAARDLGADWLLTLDPDERLERGFADWLPGLMAQGRGFVWSFDFRELFAPDLVRTDGLWGGKSKIALFPTEAAKVDPAALLHAAPVGDAAGFVQRKARITLYHLRMAAPARRQLRRDLYAAADPERRFQAIGYDYLTDERGMVLEPIPTGRAFHPPFVEDHGLWSPDPGQLGALSPDPYAVRFARAARSARRLGQRAARHVLQDLLADSPQDHDLAQLAARHALDGGEDRIAADLAGAVLEARPGDPCAQLTLVEAALAQGARDRAARALQPISHLVPDSPLLAALREEAGRDRADFTAPTAGWRSVAPPDAVLQDGHRITRSDLATVVIGFRSQPGLLAAVQSLLAQDQPTEIVVVNSGGGAVARNLAPVADHVRLIRCDTPLFVGAARNIGIAASRAPFVAFLAGDCLARPGWVAARLARHRAGADAVSSAVVAPQGAGLVSQAAALLHYGARHPRVGPRHRSHYGLSYARRLLFRSGTFPAGLRTGEDTWLNRMAARFAQPVWAPEVVTEHAEPVALAALLQADRQRGRARAAHPPYRAAAEAPDPAAAIAHLVADRLEVAQALVAGDAALSPRARRAVLSMQWLAAQADRQGTLDGLADIVRARTHATRAEARLSDRPDLALEDLALARALDPQDAALALRLGQARLALDDPAGAEAAFRAALALAPDRVEAARALVALVAGRDGPQAAWHLAETLALAAPNRARLWDLAAERALAAGQARWAVALGSLALARAVDRPWAHLRLSQWHAAAGDQLAAAFRQMTAGRLPSGPG